MPSTVERLADHAGARYTGVVRWGSPVPEERSGDYLVSLSDDPASQGGLAQCPISSERVAELFATRPDITIDGKAATPEALARRVERFWLPDEPVLYIGKATSLSGRISQYYTTALGARSPHAGGWFLKLLSTVDEIYVHYVTSQEPEQTEHAMLEGFCAGVSAATRAALHDPDHPFPFANLEWPRGTRKRHGLSGVKAAHSGRPPTPQAAEGYRSNEPRPKIVASRSASPSSQHRTQRVTAADLRAGRIRIPIGPTKRLFPPERTHLQIELRGTEMLVRYDPRYGPDRERSAVITIGRNALNALVGADEVLSVSRSSDGTIRLD